MQYTEHTSQSYSEKPLIWSPMGQKKLAVLIGDCISNFFYKKMYGCFAGQQKDGHNDEMTVKPGLSVYILHYMSTDIHKMKEK